MVDYGPLYQAAGTQFGVDPLLLQSLATEESDQTPNATGPVVTTAAGPQQARGLFQFMPDTANQYGVNVNSPNSSAYGAANYIDDLLRQHNGDLKAALAVYGGTTPNSPYVAKIMNRYTGLTNAWAGKNFQPPTSAPMVFTEQKGNPGQPAPTVPTTGADDGQADSMTLNAPAQSGEQPAASSPEDIIKSLQPHVDDKGQPIPAKTAPAPAAGAPAKTAPAADAAATDDATQTILNLQPQVTDQGKTIDTGQYLTAPTGPSAKALGTPIAEDRVPGPAFQAKINVATDLAQKVRIAADQLGVTPDSIIISGGRLAAVDSNGQPYYIEPQPVFASSDAITRGEPGTPWHPVGAFHVNPYDTGSPLAPEAPGSFASGNLVRGGAAALPGTIQNALTALPAAAAEYFGGPSAGSATAGVTSYLTGAGRQWLANKFDPDQSRTLPAFSNSENVKSGFENALLWRGGNVANKLLDPALDIFLNRPIQPSTQIGASPVPFARSGIDITRQQPYGYQDRLAPWEAPQRWELPPTVPPPATPAAPSSPVPGAAPPAEGARLVPGGALTTPEGVSPEVQLNPAGEAAAASGPYAPSSAAEIAAIPSDLPPQRWPITNQAAAEARADEIIRHFAAGGPTDADTRVLVPGSAGTLSQITGNAGLATLERGMRNLPEATNLFSGVDTAQTAARRAFTERLVGTPEDLAALKAMRENATTDLRNAAFANTTPTDTSEVVAEIDKVLAGPEGKRPGVAGPLRDIRNRFYQTDPTTGKPVLDAAGNPIPETDPGMLYGVRKSITDDLSPLARGTATDARAAASQLQPVLTKLDTAIAAGAPGYPAYMDAFRAQSGPVDAMEYLQGRNLTDAAGNPTLAKVDATIKDATKQRTLQSGARPADSLTDEQIQALTNLRDDLRRQANLSKGKAIGSPTVQNLATSAVGNKLMGPAAKIGGKLVGGAIGAISGGGLLSAPLGIMGADYVENRLLSSLAQGNTMVRDAVIRRLMNAEGSGVRALGGGPPPVSGP